MDFYLSNLKTKNDLLKILCERWGFEYTPGIPIPFPISIPTPYRSELIGRFGNFFIFYFVFNPAEPDTTQKIERFLADQEREILAQAPDNYRREALFITSTPDGEFWHFLHPEKVGRKIKLKRFSITPETRNKLRTACEQLDNLRVNPEKDSTETLVRKKEDAFNTEAVTEGFFKNYRQVFEVLKNYLLSQDIAPEKNTEENAHRYVHQTLNRLMFLYFVQKKGVFGGNKDFLNLFWNAYRDNFEGKNRFHKEWLECLFFESLNNRFFRSRDYFQVGTPYPDFNLILKKAPYLNGGLFKRLPELDDLGYQIDDASFQTVFDFLESYNFTVEESTTFDQEIAINPEMLGYIYEMLVNVSETSDERHQAGIFYTPRAEVELMLRRSLVEFLSQKTGIQKTFLYEFIFAEKGEQKTSEFNSEKQTSLLKELDEIKILDPACGSGHYLVVALDILFELKKELYKQAQRPFNTFDEKKRIIERSLFGVDIKRWATEIAKLRLWLNLFLEAEDEQLKHSLEPLLPSLSFKVRVGDSLVQSLGQLIPLRKFKLSERFLAEKAKTLIEHKTLAYENKYPADQVMEEEKNFLSQVIYFEELKLAEEIKELQNQIENLAEPVTQGTMLESVPKQGIITGKVLEDSRKQLTEKEAQRVELDKFSDYLQQLLKENAEPPLIWDIGFAEVFSKKDGFDVVVANPPYVRQELIAEPQNREDQPVEQRRIYKERLLRQLQQDWEDPKGNLVKIDKKSDLYVYFYLKGLKLLNKNGIMCYVSSNSWLDVEYGKDLQKILLKRVPVLAIYDNQAKRSFKHADVNTIIAIFAAPKTKDWSDGLKENLIRFVVFKKPFEEVAFTETFLSIEDTAEKVSRDEYRVFPIKQFDLWKDGIDNTPPPLRGRTEVGGSKIQFSPEHATYTGNKWGGKYLRAPDIYWTILEKGKGKLVRLGDIAEVRRGFTTGANEFFYLDEARIKEWGIEEEFLKPVIKSPQECKRILINYEDLKHKIFMCHKNKKDLKGASALEYIKWGESQEFHRRPTCNTRLHWWNVGIHCKPTHVWQKSVNDRHIQGQILFDAFVDQRLYELEYPNKPAALSTILNSAVFLLAKELIGRVNLGEGALDTAVFEANLIDIVNPNCLEEKNCMDTIKSISRRDIQPIGLEFLHPDRRALDNIVFDVLGLTHGERDAVYEAVIELVKNRLEKARSV